MWKNLREWIPRIYIVPLIEGTPYIGCVPVEPGLTNVGKSADGSRVIGLNTENEEIAEGLVRFDIVFYVRMRDGLTQMIINVEAQKGIPTEYQILNRAIFYVSRLISSQKERDFENSAYDDIKRVYSIWVCLNMEENSLAHIHLMKDDILGNEEWKGKLDLFNIVMIGLAKDLAGQEEAYELHRLLGALLSGTLTVNEKLKIIGEEYDIPLEAEMREDVKVMCNLSLGIEEEALKRGMEKGMEKGMEQGREEGVALTIRMMQKKGFSVEQIADILEKRPEEIAAVLQGKELIES